MDHLLSIKEENSQNHYNLPSTPNLSRDIVLKIYFQINDYLYIKKT